jgi:hypothetical protein
MMNIYDVYSRTSITYHRHVTFSKKKICFLFNSIKALLDNVNMRTVHRLLTLTQKEKTILCSLE